MTKVEKAAEQAWKDDAPLSDISDDALGRQNFARQVAARLGELSSPESFVVGLYGVWGEGKTTLLNFIRTELEEKFNSLTVWFNPWRMPSEEALLHYFIDELRTLLGKSSHTELRDIGQKAEKILDHFDTGSAKLLKGMISLAASQDLDKLKQELSDALRESKQRITIFVDDIDRLDVDEIRVVFRIVKLLGALPYTSFVLAFDDALVAKALSSKYPDAGQSGQQFLEKIVQVPLSIPRAKKVSLRQICFSMLEEIIDQHEIELTSEEQQRFVLWFQQSLEPRLTTPRIAKQYANVLRFSIPMLKGEVNLVDLMLVEGLKVFFPPVYDVVKKHLPMFAIDRKLEVFGGEEDGVTKKVEELIAQSSSSYSNFDRKELLDLIKHLFPRHEGSKGAGWEEEWQKKKRVCSAKYADRYFAYGLSADEISDVEFDGFLKSLGSMEQEEVDSTIDERLTRLNAADFIQRLRQHEETLAPESSKKIALSVCARSKTFPNPPDLFNFMNPYNQVAIFLGQLVRHQDTVHVKKELAELILTSCEPVTFGFEVFRWIRVDPEERDQVEYPSEDEERRLIQVLIERVQSEAAEKPFFTTYKDASGVVLGMWKHWGDETAMRKFLEAYLKEQPSEVWGVLRGFCGTSHSDGISKPYIHRNTYNSIFEVISPEFLIDKILECAGVENPDQLTPEVIPSKEEAEVACEFVRIHLKVGKEESDN